MSVEMKRKRLSFIETFFILRGELQLFLYYINTLTMQFALSDLSSLGHLVLKDRCEVELQ